MQNGEKKMLNRKTLINELTKYELQWFMDQEDDKLLAETTEFFANGGFVNWSDDDLVKKYELFIMEGADHA
jgi:hypothetical protein